jgi:hypothetical protein
MKVKGLQIRFEVCRDRAMVMVRNTNLDLFTNHFNRHCIVFFWLN